MKRKTLNLSEGNGKPLKYKSQENQMEQKQPKSRPSVSGNKRVLRIPGGKTKRKNEKIQIGTWNVRSLCESGKFANTVQEMERINIDILGICETWWSGNGKFNSGGVTMYYAGNNNPNHRNGVGIIVSKKVAQCVLEFVPFSDRLMLLKLNSNPLNINIIQAYAPTTGGTDDEIENFYAEISELLKLTKPHEINIIMGDFNSKVGNQKVENIVGPFGLGNRNERGDRLIQFCQAENFKITNTWFCLPPRRLYTWTSPQNNINNIVRNQIDYIMVNKRYSSSVCKVSTYPGADVPSDHVLLLANIKLKVVATQRVKESPKYDYGKLKDEHIKSDVALEINNQLGNVMCEDNDVGSIWNKTKTILKNVVHEKLGRTNRVQKQTWMTTEILNLMNERRKYKNKNDTYKLIQRTIRVKIRAAKKEWLKNECKEIERLQYLHDDFNMHKKLKEVSGNCKKINPSVLVNNQGQIVIEYDDKKHVWEDYIKDLFSDNNRSEGTQMTPEILTGPPITKTEIKNAIRLSKNKKAVGPDEIPAEIIKLIDDNNLSLLENVFNKIYDTGVYPEEWLKSTFVAIPKKHNAKRCSEHRLISLMSHALKIFLKIIHTRISKTCESAMGSSQFGFRAGLGTREALLCTQVLVQNCRDVHKDVFLGFIDYEKAFDRVQHDKLIEILHRMNLDGKNIQCIKSLYWHQSAEVKNGNVITDTIKIHRGVRQGCVLSPLLFNIYSEEIFEEAINNANEGVKVNGKVINNIRYADDTTIIADSLTDLQNLMNKINEYSMSYGLNINISKTKFMIVSRSRTPYNNAKVLINNNPIERVSKFRYLGCWLNENWDSDYEVKCRIEMARSAFYKFKKILNHRDFNLQLKLRFVKCYVWSVLLYGMEAWTLKTSIMNRLEAFEMWTYRRLLKISWTERVSNIEVLRRIQQERELLTTIKRRKASYFGHIIRNSKYDMLKLIIEGKIEGRRGIGRKRMSWLRNIRNWTGLRNIGELIHTAGNREEYADIINNI